MRISDNALKSVVFFGVPGPEGVEYGGTGFLCAYRHQGEGKHFLYLATAKHVAKALESHHGTGLYIRANLIKGAATDLPIEHITWTHHPDPTVDLSIVPFGFSARSFDHTHFSLSEVGPFFADPTALRCGDVINIVGLFRLRAGSKRNMPIVHTGHIASLADSTELVPIRDTITKNIVESEVYLVEAQTLSGLSGSPVFFHETVSLMTHEAGKKADGGPIHPQCFGNVDLLGIYTGAWDGEPGAILEKDRNLRGGIRVPVGIGTVVPSWKLIELLESESMKKHREAVLQQGKGKHAASADADFGASSASDVNPTHQRISHVS
jgi:hypothetical protein